MLRARVSRALVCRKRRVEMHRCLLVALLKLLSECLVKGEPHMALSLLINLHPPTLRSPDSVTLLKLPQGPEAIIAVYNYRHLQLLPPCPLSRTQRCTD
ncbi:uncharacterized [Tachysurus ichikawai]